MSRTNLLVVTLTTILTISVLYTPQPLLPAFAREFALSLPTAALLVTVTLLPLGVAPLFFGLLLSRLSPLTMIRISVFFMAITEAAIALSSTFEAILLLRLVQGFLVPAALTALMTTTAAESSPEGIDKSMAVYVAATIVGGFCGRFFSGLIAAWLGWRASFWMLCAALVVNMVVLCFLKAGRETVRAQSLQLSQMKSVLLKPGFLHLYLTVFCFFFVFQAVLNFLPFRLTEFGFENSELRAAALYFGYLAGLAACLTSSRVAFFLGGQTQAMILGLFFYLLSLTLFAVPVEKVLYAVMFLFCGTMFFVHSIAPGVLNARERRLKGVVNGLYIAFYYLGGTLGSYLPGFIYRSFGWTLFLAVLGLVVLMSLWLAATARKHLSPS